MLAVWIATDPGQPDASRGLAFVRAFLHRGLVRGWGAGTDPGPVQCLPYARLQPGDILVGANPACAYGGWSHVSLYLGEGEVLGYDLLAGIYPTQVEEFAHYRRLRVLRPRLAADERAKAADWGRNLVGGVFCLFALREDPQRWTCAKAVWAAFARRGLDLAPAAVLVTPADLAESSAADVVWEAQR